MTFRHVPYNLNEMEKTEVRLYYVTDKWLGCEENFKMAAFSVHPGKFKDNKPFYSCVLSCQAFDLE